MPPRESELPEGTDHIINGAMETGTGGAGGAAAGAGGGFVGGGASGDDTGGTASDGGVRSAMREGVASLKQQATDRVRQLADDGKTRASDALDDISRAIEEVAETIEDRVGGDYAGYARRAADAVSQLGTTLREREVEELYQDAQEFVRKSPGIAISIAAIAGFALVRLVKAGMPDNGGEKSPGGSGNGGAGRKGSGTGA